MKTKLALVVLLLAAIPSGAGQVPIMWDRNPEPEVTSYVISWGPVSRFDTSRFVSYPNTFSTASVSNLLGGVALGTNYFAVKARVDTNGLESVYSDEVSTVVRPGKPNRVRLSLQGAPDPAGPWGEVTNTLATIDAAGMQFFRGYVSMESESVSIILKE